MVRGGDHQHPSGGVTPMQIDRYRVQRLLGQGGMGRVYLGVDPKLGREVAIKVMSSNVRDAKTRERFQLEARAISVLKHPNIVELYDYSGDDGADLFLVLEYVPGKTLYELLEQRGLMSERVALCVGHELALALCHAHRFKVVHRDIKPENVLLDRGRVVLADFGVVKVFEASEALGVDTVPTNTQTIGTPGFMAPEQFIGRGIDHRTDIFAVGAVLYNLTTGHLPYEGKQTRALYQGPKQEAFTDPREHSPHLSDGFCDLLSGCLAPKPKDRWKDPGALLAGLLEGLEAAGVTEVRHELAAYEAGETSVRSRKAARREARPWPGRPAAVKSWPAWTSLVFAAVGGFALSLFLQAMNRIPVEWTVFFEGLVQLLALPRAP